MAERIVSTEWNDSLIRVDANQPASDVASAITAILQRID